MDSIGEVITPAVLDDSSERQKTVATPVRKRPFSFTLHETPVLYIPYYPARNHPRNSA